MKNVGKEERFLRIIIAVALFFVSFNYFSGTIQIIGYILSGIFLLTAITGFCGIYKLFNINTIKK